ncbi:hypothetical protein [Pseudonocardia sp. TRM90224]|uniref:hypothetical protein n=1 Tax=Pseudonocardia sp. TRM90224 TaxID=2812678 RepID=UPI001E313731|nr:hypothetical protein [Pseudonocardia sp. TRM90224]
MPCRRYRPFEAAGVVLHLHGFWRRPATVGAARAATVGAARAAIDEVAAAVKACSAGQNLVP